MILFVCAIRDHDNSIIFGNLVKYISVAAATIILPAIDIINNEYTIYKDG